MRNALVILVIVALVLVAVGAVNHAVAFDLDFLALTWTGVSLFWLTVALAAVVLVAGLAAASLARSAAVAEQRKLEKELAGTYERLRAAQAAVLVAAPVLGTDARGVTDLTLAAASLPVGGETAVAADQTSVTALAPVAPADGADGAEVSLSAGPSSSADSTPAASTHAGLASAGEADAALGTTGAADAAVPEDATPAVVADEGPSSPAPPAAESSEEVPSAAAPSQDAAPSPEAPVAAQPYSRDDVTAVTMASPQVRADAGEQPAAPVGPAEPAAPAQPADPVGPGEPAESAPSAS